VCHAAVEPDVSIIITCECGKKLRGGDELAGRSVRCPACGATLTAPCGDLAAGTGEYEIDEAASPAASPAAPRRPLARPLAMPDEETRPQPSSRGIKTVAAVLVAAGLLLLASVTWLAIHLATAPLPPSPKQPSGGGGYLDLLADAKTKGEGVVAMNNMRQLILLMRLRQASTGRWPNDLEELRGDLGPTFDKLMANPRTDENPGYLYVRPNAGDPPGTPILFESLEGKPDPEGAKGFADGRVEPGKPLPPP
jgi:hypothetical protein